MYSAYKLNKQGDNTSSETSVLGNFWGRIKGAKYRIAVQDET